jgi:hypothetical protein
MSIIRKLATLAAAFATVAAVSTQAEAALLTINDGADVWTLDVETGCTTCTVTLTADFNVGSTRAGTFLDSVQWDLTDPNVNPINIGDETLPDVFNTAAPGGGPTNWTFVAANLNANDCGGGNQNAVCGFYELGVGLGPITTSTLWTWTFEAQFAAPLTSVTSGNIRAAFNNANGSNAGIFSPNGGNFTTSGQTTTGQTTTGQTTTGTVPEPTLLSLFGAALVGAAYRLRRRKA